MLLTTLTALTVATPILASNLVWYTEPGSNKPAFTDGEKVRGVNLGNWFILLATGFWHVQENWMEPSLFGTSGLPGTDNDTQVMDEWTFCSILGRTRCAEVLEEHWDTWITEDDFKRMADYGLNTVRIPIPYWVYNVTEDEPYITQKQIPYIQKALNWSSMYGLDVMMDLHALPGSQSSYQVHTGHYTQEAFHTDSVNIDRALDALAKFVDEFTQDKYEGVVKAWELVNEPWIEAYQADNIPWEFLADFMDRAYTTVRKHENVIAGNNVSMVIVHDAFQALDNWKYWFTESFGSVWTNYGIDTHLYRAWESSRTNYEHIASACAMKDTLAAAQEWIPTFVGEMSLGVGTFCVDYKECFNLTSQDLMANSVTQRWIPVDLNDTLWQYDSSQEYCLQNYNWNNVPSYPTTAASIASGTSLPTGKALNINATASSAMTTAIATGQSVAIPTGMTAVSISGASSMLNLRSTHAATGTVSSTSASSTTLISTSATTSSSNMMRVNSYGVAAVTCLGIFLVLQ
ncbi:hypothetical protein QFC19_001180 [Naganishia cerealis]|uniref:Uncharacterized protein n=1 Tax=Naganishia cerealis TaxID=610337 RepID=A0ACC2WJ11_9TREE|nr:hypothetical protein QFC19_001180 [Naganishia cerealis]